MIRLILKENSSESDVAREASYLSWFWWDLIERTEENPYEVIWTTRDKATSIHYIDDQAIHLRYLVIKGPEKKRVVEEAKQALDVYSEQEILQMAQQATSIATKVRAIYQLSLIAPEHYESTYFAFFERFLQQEDIAVRQATILAMAYVSWSEFKPLLEGIVRTDPDVEVRQKAGSLLKGINQQTQQKQ